MELPRRVGELMKVSIVRGDMSSCAIHEVIVPKEDKTSSLCINFELVNKYQYIFLYLDNMLDKLHSTCVLSTLEDDHVNM